MNKYLCQNNKAFISGKVSFEQGHISDKLFSNQFNLSYYVLPLGTYVSGWKLLSSTYVPKVYINYTVL